MSLCQLLWRFLLGDLAHQAATASSTLTGNSVKIPSSNLAPSTSRPISLRPPFSGLDRLLSLRATLNTSYSALRVASIKTMLLLLSSSLFKCLGGLPDDRVDFASDIAFEATNDFDLAHSLCGSSTKVGLRPQIVAQPDDDYAI